MADMKIDLSEMPAIPLDTTRTSSPQIASSSVELIVPESLSRLLRNSKTLFQSGTVRDTFLKDDETVEVSHGVDPSDDVPLEGIRGDLSRMFRVKTIVKRSRHWVQWTVKLDGQSGMLPALKIKFKELKKLNTIVVVPSTLDPAPSSQLLSDILLRPENILHSVRKQDYGNESPNPIVQGQLLNSRVFSFSEIMLAVGFAYKWAQDLSSMEYTDAPSTEFDQLCNKAISKIVKNVIGSFRRFLQMWKETRDFELRTIITNTQYEFRPWAAVNFDLLEKSFRLGHEIIPIELQKAKNRFFMSSYNAENFEVRIAAILFRDFPIKPPSFVIEVVDKRGSTQTFVSHDIVKSMQMDLNADRDANGIEEPTQTVQIMKLIFYIDELLQDQTFHNIAVLRVGSFWNLPRLTTLKIPKVHLKNSKRPKNMEESKHTPSPVLKSIEKKRSRKNLFLTDKSKSGVESIEVSSPTIIPFAKKSKKTPTPEEKGQKCPIIKEEKSEKCQIVKEEKIEKPLTAKEEKIEKPPTAKEEKIEKPPTAKEKRSPKTPTLKEKCRKAPTPREKCQKTSTSEEKNQKYLIINEGKSEKGPMIKERSEKGPMIKERSEKGPMIKERSEKAPMIKERSEKGPMKKERSEEGPMIKERSKKGPMVKESEKGPMIKEQSEMDPIIKEEKCEEGPLIKQEKSEIGLIIKEEELEKGSLIKHEMGPIMKHEMGPIIKQEKHEMGPIIKQEKHEMGPIIKQETCEQSSTAEEKSEQSPTAEETRSSKIPTERRSSRLARKRN